MAGIRQIRNKIVNAVALAVVLPLMVVVYLMTRWAGGSLDSPITILILILLVLILIGTGINILRTVGPSSAALPAMQGKEPAREAGPEANQE